jgi:hypothetical protein
MVGNQIVNLSVSTGMLGSKGRHLLSPLPEHFSVHKPVLRIRIHRIHMFLDLPDPDPLVRGMDPDKDPALDPDPDPSIIMQK